MPGRSSILQSVPKEVSKDYQSIYSGKNVLSSEEEAGNLLAR